MKFCNKCGAQVEDDVMFCPSCGNQVDAAPAAEQASNPIATAADAVEAKLGDKKGLIIGAAVIVVAAILVIVLLSALFGGSGKAATKKFMKAFKNGDVKTMEHLTVPKDCRKEYYDDEDVKEKDVIKAMKPVYKTLWSGLKDEGKVKFTYEIKRVENLDKLDKLEDDVENSYGVDDLDDFRDKMDDSYWSDEYDMDADKIKKAQAVEYKWTLEVDGKKEAKGNGVLIAYKYKGSWYLSGEPVGIYSVTSQLDYDDFEDVLDDVGDAMEDAYDELD